jgi:glycosyltransferase involved in cell wall biosynthesis
MTILRVLFIEHKTVFGGGQVALLALLRAALENPRDGIESILICPPDAELLARACNLPIPIHTLDLGRIQKSRNLLVWAWNVGQRLAPTWKLAGLICRQRVDVIFANGAYSFLACVLAAKIARVPVVWWEHNTTLPLGMVVQAMIALADHIVVVTSVIRDQFVGLSPASASKISVIHNGIVVENYRERPDGKEKLKAALGLDERELVVGTVGRLSPEKGQRFFLWAAAKIRQKVPRAKFVIVGDGPLRSDLERLAADLGLADTFFLGFREDVPDLLSIMDVFVLPSLEEALGIAMLEAMAASRPVVATVVGGVGEAVIDGQTGFLVPAGDSEALAETTVKLLQDPVCRREVGRRARGLVEQNFTFEGTWTKTLAVLEYVTGRHTNRPLALEGRPVEFRARS